MTQDLNGTMSVGQAAANAKQQYYANLGAWGVFDAKSVEEFTMYGLPMYVIGTGGTVAGATTPPNPPALTTDPDTTLKVDNIAYSGNLYGDRVDTANGSYYKGPNPSGGVVAEQFRPIQPVTAPVDVTQSDQSNGRLHGAIILSFTRSSVSPYSHCSSPRCCCAVSCSSISVSPRSGPTSRFTRVTSRVAPSE